MRKLLIALVATAAVAGATATVWQAQAASFQDPTPLQRAACGGRWGPWCPPGRTRVCNPWHCWCAVC